MFGYRFHPLQTNTNRKQGFVLQPLQGSPRRGGLSLHDDPESHLTSVTLSTLRRLIASLMAVVALGLSAVGWSAENQWDISPYDVRVWIAYEAMPEIAVWQDRLPPRLRHELHLRSGAGWATNITVAPAAVARVALTEFADVDANLVEEHAAEALAADKLFLVRLANSTGQITCTVRELDCRTRIWSPTVERQITHSGQLPKEVADLIFAVFSPIALIGRVEDESAPIRMRAGLLDLNSTTPIMIGAGTMLRVVLRKSDRLGIPIPGGIEIVPWTVLLVKTGAERSPFTGAVPCEIVSGLRNPIRSRGSRRVERLALVVRPSHPQTRLELQARGDASRKLAGYDVYARPPGETSTQWIGRSDWQGRLEIASDEHPLKILYVKNGGRLLARLPLVIGAERNLTAELTDDNLRLEAEGFLRGLQEEFVDLVARRKVLAMRIRRRVEEDKLAAAEELLDEMRQLETRQDLERRMRERQAAFQTRDKAQQDRINRLFRDTRSLLQKHLDQGEIDALRDELTRAQRGQRVASPK